LKGNGRSKVALTTLKIAVLAPIPNASVTIAIDVKLGRLIKLRNPKRMSVTSVSMTVVF
jgi:hypothetical protein